MTKSSCREAAYLNNGMQPTPRSGAADAERYTTELRMKRRVASLLIGLLGLLATNDAAAAPNPKNFGVVEGTIHNVCIGVATQRVKTVKVGADGWVLVEVLRNIYGGDTLREGEKFWINLGQVPCISVPYRE